MNWQPFELPDGSYSDDTRPWSSQDVVNYLPTFADQQGTRSRQKYKTVPGMVEFSRVGDGPHRGGRDVEGRRFVVSGRYLYLVAADGSTTQLGVIPGTGRVSMTHNQIANGNELIIATGDNSYVYNTVTSTLSATGVPLVCVDFLNQRILGVDQARRFWRYSGVADGAAWDELDNESAESSPDRIVGGIVSNGEWYVFGERTIEVFSNSPTEFTAFQRSQVIEKGCASAATIQRLAGNIFFVGDDSIVYRLEGYTPIPVSPKSISGLFSKSKPQRLYAFTWEDRGYVVYYLTAQDGYTFGYDLTCQKWHRRESFGLKRWRINTLFKSNGAWYAGDAFGSVLYRLDWRTVYEGCEIMPRRMRTGVLHSSGNRVTVHALRLMVATGEDALVPDCDPPKITFFNSDGGGGAYGAFRIFYADPEGFPADNVLDADVSAAFAGASSVVLTGLALDPLAADAVLGDPVPNIEFATVNREMSDDADQDNKQWIDFALEGESHSWFWVRVSVDGALYYGALQVEGGV